MPSDKFTNKSHVFNLEIPSFSFSLCFHMQLLIPECFSVSPPYPHHLATSPGVDHFLTGLLIPGSSLPVPLFFTLSQGFLLTGRLGHTLPCQNTKPGNGFSRSIKNSTPLLCIHGHLTTFCPTACLRPSPTKPGPYSNLLSRWIILKLL